MINRFFEYFKNNLGLVNIFGKSSGRFLFLVLTAYFAYALPVGDFADFAIFWSSLRLLTFFTANNLYIIYFNDAREGLINRREWPSDISVNIGVSIALLGAISFIISLFIFQSIWVSCVTLFSLIPSVIIRNIAEFSKVDNSLTVSILIEDFIFYIFLFLFGFLGIWLFDGLLGVLTGVMFATLLTASIAIVLFKKKFNITIGTKSLLQLKFFSKVKFRLGLDYTILRGNEVLSNFAVRFLGKIYFGDLFVAYAHIMYQFYNVFALISMAVISGLQPKITIRSEGSFTKSFVKKMYLTILKTASPFISGLFLIIILFSQEILGLTFPRYGSYYVVLKKISFVGLIYFIIQPLIFILLYNNKINNIRSLNRIQYLVLILIYLLPLIFPSFNEEVWLITSMACTMVIQGLYSIPIYNRLN